MIYQTQGSGFAFQPEVSFDAGPIPTGVKLTDLNGDGRNDILLVNPDTNGGVTVLRNRTQPATTPPDTIDFTAAATYPVGSVPAAADVVDVNNDLVLDVVTANTDSNSFWITLGNNDGSLRGPTDRSFLTNIHKDILGTTPSGSNSEQPGDQAGQHVAVDADRAAGQHLAAGDHRPRPDQPHDLRAGLLPADQGRRLRPAAGLEQERRAARRPGRQPHGPERNGINGEFPADRLALRSAVVSSSNGQFVSGLINELLGHESDTFLFLNLLSPLDAALFSVADGHRPVAVHQRHHEPHPRYRENRLQRGLRRAGPSAVARRDETAFASSTQHDTRESLIANVAGDNPYFTANGGTPLSWLIAVYEDLQLAAPDATEQAQADTANTVQGRTAIVNKLLKGTEYRTEVIEDLIEDSSTEPRRRPTSKPT